MENSNINFAENDADFALVENQLSDLNTEAGNAAQPDDEEEDIEDEDPPIESESVPAPPPTQVGPPPKG